MRKFFAMHSYTEEQKKCIQFFPKETELKQHLLIEAGAGAGKTSVLMERVKWLLLNQKFKIDPAKLFIVTFSNDAAKQIKTKIETEFSKEFILNETISLIHISTIDSFFSDLVNSIYPSWWEKNNLTTKKFYMPPKLRLIDEEIVYEELKKSIYKYFISNKIHIKNLILAIDFILSGALKPGYLQNTGTFEYILKALCNETFLASTKENIRIAARHMHPATSLLLQEFHTIARHEYNNRIKRGEFTYADRTLFLKEQLQNNIPVKVQELIVDEYQDTNHIQHDILFHLVNENKARMVVVGDPKQSIYGFRNASVDVFQSLKNHINWQHIELKKNFRSEATLLNKINDLSKIVFQWNNPKFPKIFTDSYFYHEALKKYICENALEAGSLEKDQSLSLEHLNIVTCSLNPERVVTTNTDELNEINSISLENYSICCYVAFIKYWQKTNSSPWNNMVILCEENADILKFHTILTKHNIPTIVSVSSDKELPYIFEYLVALALAKCLLNENNDLDIYMILISPLVTLPYTDIEKYLINKKNMTEKIDQILSLIKEFQVLAKDNFFQAWQLLRWSLVSSFCADYELSLARHFLFKMDNFSSALNTKLNYPAFRKTVEAKLDYIFSNTEYNSELTNILPQDVEQWGVKSKEDKQLKKDNGIELKTVHKAKGLEWKHVFFYPKNGRSKSLGKFITSLSGRFIDVTWLQDDFEDMSVVKRVPNALFIENDYHEELNSKGNIKDKFFFPELRKQAELDFERQRVFYTAFTRAIFSLTIFQAKRHVQKRSGLRDDLAEINTMEIDSQKYLEEEIIIQFLNRNFNLLGEKTREGKKVVKLPEKSPWYQNEESFPKPLIDANNQIAYYDFGPKFINLYKEYANNKNATIILENNLNTNNLNNSFNENSVYKFDIKNINEINKNIHYVQTSPIIDKIDELINIKQKARKYISKGILFHASIENKQAKLNSLQYYIEKNADKVFHELEIWSQSDNKNHFTMTKRNIIDLLAIFPQKKLEYLSGKSLYHVNTNCYEVIPWEKNTEKNASCLWIIDYKTGAPHLSHFEQIINYMEIVSNLNINLQHELQKPTIIGTLCYPRRLITDKIDLSFQNTKLEFQEFSTQESLCHFMRKKS